MQIVERHRFGYIADRAVARAGVRAEVVDLGGAFEQGRFAPGFAERGRMRLHHHVLLAPPYAAMPRWSTSTPSNNP